MAEQEKCKKDLETISTKVVQNKQEIFTQMNHSRLRTKDDDFDPVNPKVTKTVKTYQRKIIRKTGPNGEVVEEIIEEGDPIDDSSFSSTIPQPTAAAAASGEPRSEICGQSKVEATYGCTTITEDGEENVSHHTTGPVEVSISGENVLHSYPVGASVTKLFRHDKTQSVTHSSVRDGQERVTYSKSEFQSISGESNLKVKPLVEKNENDGTTNEAIIEPKTKEKDHSVAPGDIPRNASQKNDVSEPVTNTESNTRNTDQLDPISRISELSEVLDFSTFNKKIDIQDKQLIKEGEVRAPEDLQSFNKVWKKMVKKHQIVFQLIVFRDLVVLARKHSPTKFVVIEYCDRKKANATVYHSPDAPIIDEKGKPKTGGSKLFSCVSTKQPPSKHEADRLFVLQISSENGGSLTEPLVLSVSTTETRDKWIDAITNA